MDEDHPRVCGKDSALIENNEVEKGSPPRMRERRGNVQLTDPRDRITPAYAGKTFAYLPVFFGARDHPRVCGKDVG